MRRRFAAGSYGVFLYLGLVISILPFLYESRMLGGVVRFDYYLLWSLGILSWLFVWWNKKGVVQLSILPVGLVFGYLIFSYFWFYRDENTLQVLITLFCCLGIFHFLTLTQFETRRLIIPALIISFTVQVIIAFGQIVQFGSNTLLVRGQFYNSGYFGNYLSSVIPVFFCAFLKKEGQHQVIRIICFALMMLGVFLLFHITARAAILGTLFGCLACLLFLHKNSLKFPSGWLIIIFVLLFLMAVAISLLIKMNSALGRITIYKICVHIFKDHFIFGVGPNRFAAVYNNYQSAYFRNEPKPVQIELLATNTLEGFNLPMQFLVEYGLVGVFVLASVIYYIFRRKKFSFWTIFNQKSEMGHFSCLVAILIAGLFSNPIHMTPVHLLITLHLAGIYKSGMISYPAVRIPFYLAIPFLACMLGLICWYSLMHGLAERTWRKAADSALFKGYKYSKEEYQSAFITLESNGPFLFNFGAEAAIAGEYTIATELLEKSRKFLAVNNLYVYLGDVYQHQGNFDLAVNNYLHAVYMVPSAVYPKFKLIECYRRMGERTLAREWAIHLLNYPVKVRSAITDELRKEVRTYLDRL